MHFAIVVLILIALIVYGGMTLSQAFLTSVDKTAVGVHEMGVTGGEIMRTDVSALTADLSGGALEVSLRNSGQVKLASFSKWDVVVQYYDDGGTYYVKWLPYVDGAPGDNQWTKKGIYLNADNQTPEVFEPGILNPWEEMVIEATVSPPPQKDTTFDIVVSTPNGVSTSISFTVF